MPPALGSRSPFERRNGMDDEGTIREAMSIRAARADVATVAAQLADVTNLPQDAGRPTVLRRIASPINGLATAAVTVGAAVLIAAFALRPASTGATQPPTGLFQSDRPVGLGDVGSEICVAVALDDRAYETGEVTVTWWELGDKGCRTSTSGPMATAARLVTASLQGPGDAPSRSGYQVSFVLQLLPSGSEEVAFTIDPGQGTPDADRIVGFRGTSTTAPDITFERVNHIDVVEPGGPDIPTPSTQ